MNNDRITQCQWIGNGPGLKPTCCLAPVEGRSYCAEHLPLVYKAGTAVRRKKDTRRANSVRLWESLFNEAVEELEAEGVDWL
jgi:hypothetical protein